jgi:hypothetical protein
MSKKPTIKFTISTSGHVTMNVLNVKGPRCEELTKPFEEPLGIIVQRDLKDAFYEDATAESTATAYESQ